MQATSPHGLELHGLELHGKYIRLCGDIITDSQTRFEAMLAGGIKRAARSGSLDLKRTGGNSAEIASTLNPAAAGQKRNAKTPDGFANRTHCLVRIAFAGLSA